MAFEKNLISLCLQGKASVEEVDDWVHVWHNSPELACELSEYLGMSREEYGRWVLSASAIHDILKDRKDVP